MNCDACQNHLCEQLDSGPDDSLPADAGEHLSGCPACRQFQRTLRALDAQLSHSASRATLPADFAANVLARLPRAKPRLSPAEIAERKARYEREHRAAMLASDWSRPFRQAAVWLRLASFAGLCAGIGWLLADALRQPALREAWMQFQSFTVSTESLLASGLGLASLVFGVLVGRRPALLGKLTQGVLSNARAVSR
jgi:hypothetical protein